MNQSQKPSNKTQDTHKEPNQCKFARANYLKAAVSQISSLKLKKIMRLDTRDSLHQTSGECSIGSRCWHHASVGLGKGKDAPLRLRGCLWAACKSRDLEKPVNKRAAVKAIDAAAAVVVVLVLVVEGEPLFVPSSAYSDAPIAVIVVGVSRSSIVFSITAVKGRTEESVGVRIRLLVVIEEKQGGSSHINVFKVKFT